MKRLLLLLLLALPLQAQQSFAQSTQRVQVQGQAVNALDIGGVPYIPASALSGFVVRREGNNVRVEYAGRTVLLLLEERQQFAALGDNPVQFGLQRGTGRAATLQGSQILLPLDTLFSALGGQVSSNNFAIPPVQVRAISAVALQRSDRVVIDLSAPAEVRSQAGGGFLQLTIKNARLDVRSGQYETRGAYLPRFEVVSSGADTVLRLPLPRGAGWRSYQTPRGALTRLSIDVGPGVQSGQSAIEAAAARPLILLIASGGAQPVARETAALLSRAGWQVEISESADTPLLRRAAAVVQLSVAGRGPGGIGIFTAGNRADSRIVGALRDQPLPNSAAVIAPQGASRELGSALGAVFRSAGLEARLAEGPRLRVLQGAAGAAVVLSLGSLEHEGDRARLESPEATRATALMLARVLSRRLTERQP